MSNADLRILFDTLYENRKRSLFNDYFSVTDIMQLTANDSFSVPLATLLKTASSYGILLRYQIYSLSTPDNLVYVYRWNPNILKARPTNINLFKNPNGCPPIPTCLLFNGGGPFNFYQGNGMLGNRDNFKGGLKEGGTLCSPLDPPWSPEFPFYQPFNESRICSCMDGTLTRTFVTAPAESPACNPEGCAALNVPPPFVQTPPASNNCCDLYGP